MMNARKIHLNFYKELSQFLMKKYISINVTNAYEDFFLRKSGLHTDRKCESNFDEKNQKAYLAFHQLDIAESTTLTGFIFKTYKINNNELEIYHDPESVCLRLLMNVTFVSNHIFPDFKNYFAELETTHPEIIAAYEERSKNTYVVLAQRLLDLLNQLENQLDNQILKNIDFENKCLNTKKSLASIFHQFKDAISDPTSIERYDVKIMQSFLQTIVKQKDNPQLKLLNQFQDIFQKMEQLIMAFQKDLPAKGQLESIPRVWIGKETEKPKEYIPQIIIKEPKFFVSTLVKVGMFALAAPVIGISIYAMQNNECKPF